MWDIALLLRSQHAFQYYMLECADWICSLKHCGLALSCFRTRSSPPLNRTACSPRPEGLNVNGLVRSLCGSFGLFSFLVICQAPRTMSF